MEKEERKQTSLEKQYTPQTKLVVEDYSPRQVLYPSGEEFRQEYKKVEEESLVPDLAASLRKRITQELD